MPIQAALGSAAATGGFLSDLLSNFQSPTGNELTGDVNYEQNIKLPYGTQELSKMLPLQPTTPNERFARGLGEMVPVNPAPALRAVGKVGEMALRGAGEMANARMLSGESMVPGLSSVLAPSGMKFATEPENKLISVANKKEPQMNSQEKTLRIFRGGINENPEYSVIKNHPSDVFGGAFGSTNLEAAQGHGSGVIHFTDIPESKVLSHYALNYEVPYEKSKKALLKARPDLKDNPELFDELYDVVIGDIGQDLRKLDDDKIIDLLRKEPSDANNEVQRLRGQVAKNLGYKAIEMVDEHGQGTYIVLPGVKFKRFNFRD